MNETEYGPLFEHEYDGIREYDNPLPGWWKTLFWLTILFCFPYAVYYHGHAGRSIKDDYEAEVAAFAAQLIATYGELSPDAPTIARFMDDDVAMTGMASLFRSKCAQCHRADGSGNIGPNLTDRNWLHVKKLTDIYKVISEGVPAKGMPTWKDQLTETQRVLMSAYVARLSRHPVAGKEPQGDLVPSWEEAGDAPGKP